MKTWKLINLTFFILIFPAIYSQQKTEAEEIDSLIDYLVSNFNIFEKVDIWGSGQIKNYFQEDILDSNYLNFNKIGNKLVYDYFANDFRKKEANKNLINLQSNLSEKQQNLIS